MKKAVSLILSLMMLIAAAATVPAADEDITSNPAIFPLNTTTVTDLSHADAGNSGASYVTMQKGQYIEYTVNTQTEQKYALTFTSSAANDETVMHISVNGTVVLSAAPLTNTGGHSIRNPHQLGIITLTAGENVIKFQTSGGAVVAPQFALTKFEEGITANPAEFPLNNTTTQNFTGASSDSYDNCMTLWEGNSLEYVLMTETAGDYLFALQSGTPSGVSIGMSVAVNGLVALTSTTTDGTGYGTRTYRNMGVLSLKPGVNVIKIANTNTQAADGHNAAVVTNFKLTKATEDITADPMVFPLNSTTVDLGNADAGNSAASHATMQNGQYVEYTVNTKQDAYYLLTFNCGTSSSQLASLDVSVNGTLALDNAYLAESGGFGTRVPHELGIIHLTPGANVIKFQTVGGAVVSTQFSLSKKRLEYTIPVDAALSAEAAAVESTIMVLEAGWYGVTADTTAAENSVIRVSANGAATAKAVSDAGSSYLGRLYLAEGSQTVQIAATEGTATITSVTLSDVQNDLTEAVTSIETDIDKETVTTALTEGETALALTAGTSFSVTILAEKALNYALSMTSSGTGKFTVNVNGYDQLTIADAASLGIVNLNRGENTIAFTLTEGEVTVDKLAYTLTDSFQSGSCTVWAQEGRVPDYYFVSATSSSSNDGFYAAHTCVTMRDTTWLEYDIYTTEDQYVYLSAFMASPDNGAFSVSVNGAKQIDKEYTGVVSTKYTDFTDHQLKGLVRIPAGHSAVRITYHQHGCNVKSFTFTECPDDLVLLEGFELVTAEGARLPYVVRDGFTAYANVDVLKLGSPTGAYRLMLAQYAEDKTLVDVSITEIDISTMADKEYKTFTAPLTYKGSGGWVKAFLMDKETLAPQEKSIMYQDNMYFSEDVLEETITYTDATNVLNSAGEYYGDYSIHDDTYDIDAIFYDSVVGEQTKVFAYIGVPKGATEENPVPAVVCVHGGAGIAFSEWVKIWNDRGYAAIAMSLTGDGPAATGTSTDLTPYMGQHCWGSAAFLADYENAAMYQNVLNVVRAHNLLRAWPGVDETRTGITGISWGGVTTTTVIGVDNRFTFAVPVYGCGYLDESETYFSSYFTSAENSVMWDPANFAARSTVPTLYVNSDYDEHFSINSTTKSSGVTEGSRISIRHHYGHDYTRGWGAEEIYTFADGMVTGYDPFITITDEQAENSTFTATYTAPEGITAESAVLYYITEDKLPYGGKENITWNQVSDCTIENGTITFTLPAEATFCYATVTDSNGSLISTKYKEVQ